MTRRPPIRAAITVAVLAVAASCGRGPDARQPSAAGASPATAPAASAQAPPASIVSVSVGAQGTAYSTADGPCRLTWVAAYEGVNSGVVMHGPDCARPFAALAPLAGRILDAIAAEPSRLQALRTIHWGRIFPDGAQDDTLAVRVALAAWRSPEWNPKTGRPRSGDVNGFVRDVARRARVCRELEAPFRARGLILEPAAVEKVLISRAGDLPFAAALVREGVPAEDRVPWDAQLWLSIRPGGPS